MENKSRLDLKNIKEILAKTKVIPTPVCEEMSKSFIAYAMAVNVSRAIPDVRDGLKPVHRRIIFAMNDLGNTYDKPHKKCARIVGEVLGKYHPHGDSSVYDALVRLAQDFSIRAPLVDGHGNFGSVDGDPPAAQRYTEARLSKIAGELIRDIDKDTVDFYPNFDDTLTQPTVLPAKFPNLLVNGAEGIAVGMATSIPPHNLGEVIDGTVALIDNPELTPDELMEYIPCPDYPTGGLVLGRAGVKQAYRTGKGSVVIRSKCEIEEVNGKNIIVVTELPYQVNKAELIKNIAEQVKDKKIEGIANIREESDRFGMRIVFELKRDASPQVVLNTLYKQSKLQVSTGINFLALVDGTPKVLNLAELLSAYIRHQVEVVERRTRYLLGKAVDRDHILRGLVIALANIDEVVAILKKSKETSDARMNLMAAFELSERQANAILDMKLSRLTSLEVEKLRAELEEIERAIADYRDILARPERVREIIKTELIEVKEKYATPRKSEPSYDMSEINIADLIEKEDVVVTMTYQGYIKRISTTEYKSQNRGGVGVTAHKAKDEDFISKLFICNTHDDLLFFSDRGKVYCLKAYEIPEASKTAKGRAVVNLLPLETEEKITAFLSVKDYSEGYMMMATKNGLIKKCDLSEFERIRSNGKIAITLTEGDSLIGAELTNGGDELIMASYEGKCIRFAEGDVRKTGRGSQGVRSMKLEDTDYIVDMAVIKEGSEVVTVTEKGFGKRTDTEDYRLQGRAGKGIKAGNFTEETGKLVGLKLTSADDDIIMIADTGIMIRIHTSDISKIGRNTKGVRLMRIKGEGKVAAVALTPHEEEEAQPVEETEVTATETEVVATETPATTTETEN
ncbi:MAG: DNA gyrase subunit A [Clostridia bacterium]|nr:DNA gyrase subunit A [Clostridia bacterium]